MSITFTRILLACNDSGHPGFVLAFAANLARKYDAKLTVIMFSKTTQDYAKLFEGIQYEVVTRPELSVKEIENTANDVGADLVITTISNKVSEEGLMNYKDAAKMIEHLNRPVITIPGNFKTDSFENIVAPIDTSFETRQKGPYVISIARKMGTSMVHIVGVSTDKGKDAQATINNYTRQVSNKIAEDGVGNDIELRLGGNITEQALDYVKQTNSKMIVIMTEQEVNFKSFFAGKYSEQMIKFCPVAVFNVCPKELVVSEARL